MSSNLKENRYAFATGYRKSYLPSVACRQPKMVGKHWISSWSLPWRVCISVE